MQQQQKHQEEKRKDQERREEQHENSNKEKQKVQAQIQQEIVQKQPEKIQEEDKIEQQLTEGKKKLKDMDKKSDSQDQFLVDSAGKNDHKEVSAEFSHQKSEEENRNLTKKISKISQGCNCQKSKCSKNYCECFTQGRRCTELCKCMGCENNFESDARNRPDENEDRVCYCKKTNCLKKYCECFSSGNRCSSNCKCEQCRNTDELEGEEEEKEEVKERSESEIKEINAKIDEIANITPQEHQEYILSFLEYWLT